MPSIPFLETVVNASPAAAVFIIAVLALLVAWQALTLAGRSLRRNQGDDQ